MKTWLVAAAKFLAEFLILLAFFAAAGAFASTLDSPDPLSLTRAAAREALRTFPWVLALTLGLGVVSWRSERQKGLGILLSVCFLGSLLGLAGMAARWTFEFEDSAVPPALVVGRALETGDRLVSVESIGGGLAQRVAAANFASPFPRLLYSSSSPWEGGEDLNLGGVEWTLARPPREVGVFALPFLGPPPLPLDIGREEGPFKAGLATVAFVLLCAGLAAPALGIRWPLAAFSYGLLAIALAVGIEYWFGLPASDEALLRLLAPLRLNLAGNWLVPGVEGVLGLIVGTFGLLFARRLAA